VHQVGLFTRLYRDAWSTKNKIPCSVGTVQYVNLTSHLHLMHCFRMHGAVPPLPHVFMTCIGQIYFYYNNSNNLWALSFSWNLFQAHCPTLTKLYLSCHKLVCLSQGWNSYYLVIFEQQQPLYIPRSSSVCSSWHVFDDVRAFDSLAAGRGELRKPWRQTNFICLKRETNFMKLTMY